METDDIITADDRHVRFYVQDGVLGAIVIVAVILSTDRRSIGFVK